MPNSDPPGSADAEASASRTGSLASTFELIARARTGDVDALEQLFQLHFKRLQRWATGRLPIWARDLADTDDIVQDTLIQTFKRIEVFEPQRVGSLQAYLRQAILNRIRDELRRKGRRPAVGELADDVPDTTASPLEQAIGGQAVERYEGALGRLRSEDREAIIGRIEMGYTYAELAEALGKPSAEAARKTAERALVRLAEEMARDDG